MRRLTNFFFLLQLFFVSGSTLAEVSFTARLLQLKDQNFRIEIADTTERRMRGLMYRESMHQQSGMLFLYQQSGNYRIWMKNTLIPLTVLWLDKEAKILQVKALKPCIEERCPVYGAGPDTRFILELHADQYPHFKTGEFIQSLLLLKKPKS